ncbi:DUF1566 domain-containing protein [Pseudoalteromonas sp.]|uniref:Lcl C-terminal domain-containing protein n=1 Tax=Pseudoalteromonas sp. TaxID=53249 RepID=UPI0035675B30
MLKYRHSSFILTYVSSLLIVGCGGSSSSSEEVVVPLSVNAGADISLDEKLTFSLKAVASPEGGKFTWRQLSGPLIEGFPLEGATQEVTAPDVKQDQVLELAVEYVAPDNRSASDTVFVAVNSVNLLPVVSIKQTAPLNLPSQYGDTIVLSSADSFDPDENGKLVSYLWQQIAGSSLSISNTTLSNLTFTHPLLAQNEDVTFKLTITDDEGGKHSNSLTLTLQQSNQLLYANAGANQSAQEFSTVTLDASKSTSIDGSFSCAWVQQSGVSVSLNTPELCKTQFIVPDVDAPETLIFEVMVTDAGNRTDNALTQVLAEPKALGLINDTGMHRCFDNSNELSNCVSADFPGQDAAKGRDVHASLLDKVGSGPGAFDFTKLDQFAGELPDNATDFSCVRDNISGLIWEVKQESNGTLPNTQLREAQNSYSWFLSSVSNGGETGAEAPARISCPSTVNCGLEQYITEVNEANYCGGNNWRVPSHRELSSLLYYAQQGSGSVMIADYFPNTATQLINDVVPYWTMQTSVEGGQSAFAWAIDMITGKDVGYPKQNLGYVRLVRDTSNND